MSGPCFKLVYDDEPRLPSPSLFFCVIFDRSILVYTDTSESSREKQNSSSAALRTAEVVATTAVVCVVCSFTAGLLLGVLLTQCHSHCHRKGKRGQTEIPPVYEDTPLENTPAIELKTNDAYGPISK